MKTAIIFIAYHPGSLVEYYYLARLDNKRSSSVLIICRHPYVTEEMISAYSKDFDHVVVLPNIEYEFNVIRGLARYYRFIRYFIDEIGPTLRHIDTFDIISDCSAYLPVNALISNLKKNAKCRRLISIREDYDVDRKIQVLPTIRTTLFTSLLGLYRVHSDKSLRYLYVKEPRDMIVRLLGPFENSRVDRKDCAGAVPTYFLYKSLPERAPSVRDVIVYYSDRNIEYVTGLSKKEHSKRMKTFLLELSAHYRDCEIICKTHPLDKGEVVDEMREIAFELYKGDLASQMHIDMNANVIRACYSIASTSLLYAASVGIPAYTIYKYLGYDKRCPREFFENDSVGQNRFLCHIQKLEQIGEIDNIHIEPMRRSNTADWEQIMYSHNV